MSKELMEKRIKEAQNEIDRKEEIIKKGALRQHYHFMPQTGWLNDPNGLIYFRGNYHYFYQYNPYYGHWDCMHWGHAISDDLLHWKYLPLALAPSEYYDDHMRGGCFSGSAIEHEGKLYLIYTSTAYHAAGYEQTQCVAYSEDGIHFEKYSGNPVLHHPEGVSADFFRDPKVWKHDGTFYMVCGASRDNKAQALLYRSEDLFHWSFVNVLAESRGEWGTMWECPDFFRLEDKYILTFSPIKSGEHTAMYFVGDFDYNTGKFVHHIEGEIDWGMDFYAPQSFQASDGRRITVGWANEWEWMPFYKDWGPTFKEGWCGFFNLPREVRLMPDHTLQFKPVEELKELRENEIRIPCFVAGEEEKELPAGDGISFEIKMKIDLLETTADKLELSLRCGDGKRTACIFDFAKAQMQVDRNAADGWSQGVSRSDMFLKGKSELDIHIFSDQSSLEIFTDQYQNNHANNIFAGNEQNQIKICAQGGSVVIKEYEAYRLKECFR